MGSQLAPRLWQGTPMPHATGHSCASMVKIAHWRLILFGAFPRPLPGKGRGFFFLMPLAGPLRYCTDLQLAPGHRRQSRSVGGAAGVRGTAIGR